MNSGSFYCILQDVVWINMTEMELTLHGVILRCVFDLIMLIAGFMIARKTSDYHTKTYDFNNNWSSLQFKMD